MNQSRLETATHPAPANKRSPLRPGRRCPRHEAATSRDHSSPDSSRSFRRHSGVEYATKTGPGTEIAARPHNGRDARYRNPRRRRRFPIPSWPNSSTATSSGSPPMPPRVFEAERHAWPIEASRPAHRRRQPRTPPGIRPRHPDFPDDRQPGAADEAAERSRLRPAPRRAYPAVHPRAASSGLRQHASRNCAAAASVSTSSRSPRRSRSSTTIFRPTPTNWRGLAGGSARPQKQRIATQLADWCDAELAEDVALALRDRLPASCRLDHGPDRRGSCRHRSGTLRDAVELARRAIEALPRLRDIEDRPSEFGATRQARPPALSQGAGISRAAVRRATRASRQLAARRRNAKAPGTEIRGASAEHVGNLCSRLEKADAGSGDAKPGTRRCPLTGAASRAGLPAQIHEALRALRGEDTGHLRHARGSSHRRAGPAARRDRATRSTCPSKRFDAFRGLL